MRQRGLRVNSPGHVTAQWDVALQNIEDHTASNMNGIWGFTGGSQVSGGLDFGVPCDGFDCSVMHYTDALESLSEGSLSFIGI